MKNTIGIGILVGIVLGMLSLPVMILGLLSLVAKLSVSSHCHRYNLIEVKTMTNIQINDIKGILSFTRNIGKLSIGRSTKFKSSTGTRYGKVTCDTVGRLPRLFTVAGSEVIPNGNGYTYSKIMSNLMEQIVL